MEFACSHIVCGNVNLSEQLKDEIYQKPKKEKPRREQFCQSFHEYDNRGLRLAEDLNQMSLENNSQGPPVPPRRTNAPINPPLRGSQSPTVKHRKDSIPPPVAPRISSRSSSPRPSPGASVNVVSIHLGKLVDLRNVQSTENAPIFCKKCCAAISSISATEMGLRSIVWKCEFCNKENSLRQQLKSIPMKDDIASISLPSADYLNVPDDSLVIFCVDTSGSMCVTSQVKVFNEKHQTIHISRMQSIQDALIMSLNFLVKNFPLRRVALITFNSVVTYYGDGLSIPVTFNDFQLMDSDYLKSEVNNFADLQCIRFSFQALRYQVCQIKEEGSTALGPAALVSVALASQHLGSKVIICTDGLANIGLGYLEAKDEESCLNSKYFYTDVGQNAVKHGVIISVLTFEGTDCRLVELGRLADCTGGRVNILNPVEFPNEIQSILEDNVIATNVTATFIISEDMYFRYEETLDNKLIKEVGNVTEDTEITFEFGIKEARIEDFQWKEKVPFQLQLRFQTRDRRDAIRIVTQEKYITTNSSMVEDSINISVLGIHVAQLSARLAMEGRTQEAQKEVLEKKQLIQHIVDKKKNQEQEDLYENWFRAVESICDVNYVDFSESNTENLRGNIKDSRHSLFKAFSDELASVVYRLKNAKGFMLKKSPEKLKRFQQEIMMMKQKFPRAIIVH
ncbi:circularly permutated Ras protein 1-like [Protopterus annectens]|uniref:circularly permutated Ras protein 1-like n=1 Tax=Protopterus annectens TaxID=7888 RepID=UPI001CF9E37E|nr:circularly permutated Ras protein 1-like [Protopterus annectens]